MLSNFNFIPQKTKKSKLLDEHVCGSSAPTFQNMQNKSDFDFVKASVAIDEEEEEEWFQEINQKLSTDIWHFLA